MKPLPYVFEGGPLDGHEITAAPRTAIYRDAMGSPMNVAVGDRLSSQCRGLYEIERRPMRFGQGRRIITRRGVYRWLRPVANKETNR